MTKTYIVQTAAAKMPSSCWGKYRRVAVLEVDPGVTSVAMISDRARGVRSIVQTWERLSVGTTKRCSYQRALAEAHELADQLTAAAVAAAAGAETTISIEIMCHALAAR